MRLAIAIIGLMLVVGFLFEGLFENAVASGDASPWRGGFSSIIVAAPWIFAAMYVFWLPRLAAVLFIASGALAWIAAAATSQTALWVWGGVAFILAAGSIVAARQQPSPGGQRAFDRGELLPTVASDPISARVASIVPIPIAEPQPDVLVVSTYPCPVCGTAMDLEQRYCQECGTPAPVHVKSRPALPV